MKSTNLSSPIVRTIVGEPNLDSGYCQDILLPTIVPTIVLTMVSTIVSRVTKDNGRFVDLMIIVVGFHFHHPFSPFSPLPPIIIGWLIGAPGAAAGLGWWPDHT